MYTMLHNHTKIPSAALDLAPHSKTTTFCLSFCLHPSSMGTAVANNLYSRSSSFEALKKLKNISPPNAGLNRVLDKIFLLILQ